MNTSLQKLPVSSSDGALAMATVISAPEQGVLRIFGFIQAAFGNLILERVMLEQRITDQGAGQS